VLQVLQALQVLQVLRATRAHRERVTSLTAGAGTRCLPKISGLGDISAWITAKVKEN